MNRLLPPCIGLIALGLWLGIHPSMARERESYCRWEVSADRAARSDAWLYEGTDPRTGAATAEHLPFGFPAGIGDASSGEMLLAQPHFPVWYDTDLRTPLWTAHHLTRHEAAARPRKGHVAGPFAAESRKDSFRSDPRLEPDDRSLCRDYEEPIFDQGHMVPNSDVDFVTAGMETSLGMDHSFLMSNMTPQHCSFNRGPWMVLENLVRHWGTETDDIWIVTGAVHDRDGTPGRDPDTSAWRMAGKDGRRVAIPSALYKIVARWAGPGWQTLTVLVPNTDDLIDDASVEAFLDGRVSSLDDIERVTGLRFFAGIDAEESTSLWPVPRQRHWFGQRTGKCRNDYPDK